MPTFSISIVAYNNLALTRTCLDAVLRHSMDYELILTDNNSTDGTWDYFIQLKVNNPMITMQLVRNTKNEGFIGPNRRALQFANGEFFVLLNNDAIVTSSWLQILQQPFLHFPKAALSGPVGGCSSILPNFHGCGGERFEYLEGSVLMGKTALLKKHGLFSPELEFAYGEDSDLSLRMREQGYTLHRVPLQWGHHGGATSRMVPEVAIHQERNHVYLKKRWAHYLQVRTFDYPILLRREGAWGDVLLMTPIIRALAEQKPLSKIYVETFCTDIFRGNPFVTATQAKIAPSPETLIFDLNMAYENRPETHIIDAYAEVCELKDYDKKVSLYPNEEEMTWAMKTVNSDRYLAIHTGPTWKSKMWPAERWNELASRIQLKTDLKVLLVGTPNNEAICNSLDLRGKTTLHQLAAVLARCQGFIGVDSLVMHVAQSQDVPTCALFGVTDPAYIMSKSTRHKGICGTGKTAGARHRSNGKVVEDDEGKAMGTITVARAFKEIQEFFQI